MISSFIENLKGVLRGKPSRANEKHYKTPEEVILPEIPKKLDENFRRLVGELKNMQEFPFDLIERIYLFMDEYNQFVATFTVCEKGCSACCRIPVNLSRLEAEYIKRKTGYKLSSDVILTAGRSNCPFLADDGDCSIYRYRPYNCRTFHTLDNPKYCSSGEDHAVYGASSVGYGSDILAELSTIIRHVSRGEYNDIRSYFSKVDF